MKNLAVARRYAKALLLIGKDDGQTDLYREELDRFTTLVAENAALEQAIINPLYDAAGRKKVLQSVVERLDLSELMKSFLLLLFEKGRIGFIDSINHFYKELADNVRGVASAELISATDLPDETINKIRTALSKRTGKDVKLEVKQDPSLIGGIVTKIGDLVLDGSVKTQLQNMRESLTRGESV